MNYETIAISIVQTLVQAGYIAYFAGGWVRDFLLGNASSDIDIATNAPPEVVVSLFPKTVCVGISFGVVVVVLENRNFEVSTFRKDLQYSDGRHPSEVEYSSAQEDAQRRDFTINGMFYDPLKDLVLDYVDGQSDLKKGVIRTIGNPSERFQEDRLRMIRAIRFATRFDFIIEENTQKAIREHAHHLFPAVSMERIWQELTKMSKLYHFRKAVVDLFELDLLKIIFSELANCSLSFIETQCKPFADFPSNCPTILYIQELFPYISLEERLNLCAYLKVTNFDQKLVEFYHNSLGLFYKDVDLHTWAHFYAHSYAELLLEIQAAKTTISERQQFIHIHEKRQKKLFPHIQRIETKKPLITSQMLKELGIPPGKQMGQILKEAEKIAIEENFHESSEVLMRLKKLYPDINL